MSESVHGMQSSAGLETRAQRLTQWMAHVDTIFLSRISPTAGLLPASTAKTVHGDYADAWVRDNVYSILGLWGLSVAFRRHDAGSEDASRLEQAVVGVMRGLLKAMMGQAHKVERFKQTQDPLDGLHAKYSADTGLPVVDDDAWGHLQVDATSLFVLYVAQMSAAGLPIIRSQAEADFIQNLVLYIAPAYRIADYGIWERGRKSNDGVTEINASSVGMAKAALEAIDGRILFDGQAAPILSPPDDIARARETLYALLPGESASKETDAALLAIIGWPAFAVEDKVVLGHTRTRILDRLAGRYGCKRFLRDGHQTTVEDEHRLHYTAGELTRFANIESEWPLFFTYLLLDAEMRGDNRGSDAWAERLDPLFVDRDGLALLPELYIVPEDKVGLEAAAPGSQTRVPNENLPLLWAQSQWILASLLREGLIAPEDVDPLNRRGKSTKVNEPRVSVCVVAQDVLAEALLRQHGLLVEGFGQALERTEIRPAGDLVAAWTQIGANEALGLKGRPPRRLGALANARVYRSAGRDVVFSPTLQEAHDHHVRYDAAARARRLRGDIRYLARHWKGAESPLLVISLDAIALKGQGADRLISFLVEVQAGQVDFACTQMIKLTDALGNTGRRVDLRDHLPPRQINGPDLAPGEAEVRDFQREVDAAIASCDTEHLEHIYYSAAKAGSWLAARTAAASLKRADPRFADSAKDVVVRLRRLDLGKGTILAKPVNEDVLLDAIENSLGTGVEGVMAQEAMQALGLFCKTDSNAVRGMRTIRLPELMQQLAFEEPGGYSGLARLAPSILYDRIKGILIETPSVRTVVSPAPGFALMPSAKVVSGQWRRWRERLGVLTRVGPDFFARLWSLLHVCDGIVFGSDNRLDAAIARSDLTAWERDFALEIETRLEAIAEPAYRTLCLEALNALASKHEVDPDFTVGGDIILDDLIHAAANHLWTQGGGGEPNWTDGSPVWDYTLSASPDRLALALMQVSADLVVPVTVSAQF